ncbi:hypothetical protein [Fimbriimonas ginsengisoli]|nr:hypothetical protein [Fimbriimonas ginsengisoli]
MPTSLTSTWDAFQPPPAGTAVRRRPEFEEMWRAPWEIEPYELAPGTEPCQPAEVLEYVRFVDGLIDGTVDDLDLESQESGFSWYPNISKLSHQLMNLRHLQGHVGQLSELLLQHGVDTNWVAKVNRMLP